MLWLFESKRDWSVRGKIFFLWVLGAVWDFDSCNIQHYCLSFMPFLTCTFKYMNKWQLLFASVKIFNFSRLYEYENSLLVLCLSFELRHLRLLLTSQTLLSSSAWREPNLPYSPLPPFRGVPLSTLVLFRDLAVHLLAGVSQFALCLLQLLRQHSSLMYKSIHIAKEKLRHRKHWHSLILYCMWS